VIDHSLKTKARGFAKHHKAPTQFSPPLLLQKCQDMHYRRSEVTSEFTEKAHYLKGPESTVSSPQSPSSSSLRVDRHISPGRQTLSTALTPSIDLVKLYNHSLHPNQTTKAARAKLGNKVGLPQTLAFGRPARPDPPLLLPLVAGGGPWPQFHNQLCKGKEELPLTLSLASNNSLRDAFEHRRKGAPLLAFLLFIT